MKRFLIFVKKETLQILRDYRTMLIVILMPAVQIILFGFALSTEVNNVDVAIYAPQRGNTARRIADRIAANPYMNFKGYIKSTDEIDKKMRNGNIDIAIAIDNGIDKVEAETSPQKTVIQIFADASNPVAANTASGYVMSIINDETGGQEMPIEIETRMLYNPQLQSSYIFVPGILGFIILIICAMITSISIVREKETGTIDMLLVSPVRPIVVIGAKLVPYFVLSCVNLATILILAKYLLGVPMQGSVLLICAISLLAIHRYVARIRHTCFYNFQKPDNGDTDMRRGDDNPGDYAFRTHIPYREHPGGIAIPVVHRPGPVVYRSYAQTDD